MNTFSSTYSYAGRALFLCVFFMAPLFGKDKYETGFQRNTLIQTVTGLKQISKIRRTDKIMSFVSDELIKSDCVSGRMSSEPCELYFVSIDDELLLCGKDQLFFVANKNAWVNAAELNDGDYLVSNKDNKLHLVPCAGSAGSLTWEYLLDIQVESETHAIWVGNQSVLAHNYIPLEASL